VGGVIFHDSQQEKKKKKNAQKTHEEGGAASGREDGERGMRIKQQGHAMPDGTTSKKIDESGTDTIGPMQGTTGKGNRWGIQIVRPTQRKKTGGPNPATTVRKRGNFQKKRREKKKGLFLATGFFRGFEGINAPGKRRWKKTT